MAASPLAFAGRPYTCQGKVGNMVCQAFDQVRGKGLVQEVLKIIAVDSQESAALVDNAHFAEQDRFIGSFDAHNFTYNPEQFLPSGFDQVEPGVLDQSCGIGQFHHVQAGKVSLLALYHKILHKGLDVGPQLIVR